MIERYTMWIFISYIYGQALNKLCFIEINNFIWKINWE
jgi:hypothetical protein